MAIVKRVAAVLGGIFVVMIALGFVIDTGGTEPSDDALVYLDPARTMYFTPTRTPHGAGYIPVSYAEAKRLGAKPDELTGFNIDGPPLLIAILDSHGLMPFQWPIYWAGTNTRIERVKS